MDLLRREVDECVHVLQSLNSRRSELHTELSRCTDAERLELLGRVEPLDDNYEWRMAVNSLITHQLLRFETVLPRLHHQSERAGRTLTKISRAKPAMSWRTKEIAALLEELRGYGRTVSAEDMSRHLWDKMLDKLAPQEPSHFMHGATSSG